MEDDSLRIKDVFIENELRDAYLSYAMSVIIGRALPLAKDGLKPVHRRILYAMYKEGLLSNKKYSKSAGVVGEVLKKYHPHGDSSVYDAMVRMAQEWNMRYRLVDGQGNFGCFTGDTKVKLTDGRELSFEKLVKEEQEGITNYTYTINKSGNIDIAEIIHPRLTKKDAALVKVTLDNGEEIRCTPDHRFMVRNGSYKEAQFLEKGESLMPLYTKYSDESEVKKQPLIGYEMVYQPSLLRWDFTHHLADSYNLNQGSYLRNQGRIRHHIDFNKLNNNPDNIIRMPWQEHRRLHAQHAKELHKDPEYRKKIAKGREAYWNNPLNKRKASQRISKRNYLNWQNPEYQSEMRDKFSKSMRAYYDRNPEEAEKSRERLKQLWKDEGFRQLLSEMKSIEMKERWKQNDPSLRRFTSEESRELWKNPEHRELISTHMKQLWADPDFREKQSKISKELWKDENYRSNYSETHFSDMAKKLWANPETKKKHSKKAKNQWKDPTFRNHVMQKKILSYISSLSKNYDEITPEIYEKERRQPHIPKIENTGKYFDSFETMIEEAKLYNHKVHSVEWLPYTEDVYDLTINKTHNFALASGIFVHNSIDGDNAAAYRYTEARMTKLAEKFMQDIEKETVEWTANYDNTTEEPSVLPTLVPNLLVNGSSGIAVGMATSIPPHNLGEVIDATLEVINNPDISVEELVRKGHIKGPDFPTGALMLNGSGLQDIYINGEGSVTMRAVCKVEEVKKGKEAIVVEEIPFQLNKVNLINQIVELVKNGKIKDISDIRDESNKRGIRVVIELKKDVDPNIILNQLYKFTNLQMNFNARMLAIDNQVPKILSLKQYLSIFIDFRKEVIINRTKFELKKAQERLHILEGLKIALDNIDAVIALIKSSSSGPEAKEGLMTNYELSDQQAQAILDMRLQKLTGLEMDKIREEYNQVLKTIEELKAILNSDEKQYTIIADELTSLKEEFADVRKTRIVSDDSNLSVEDLIQDEDFVVMVTQNDYIKKVPLEQYRSQKRGGKGINAHFKEEDTIKNLFVANSKDTVLIFTNDGNVHWLKTYEVPTANFQNKGRPIVNYIDLRGKKITNLINISNFEKGYLIFLTRKGIIKKTEVNNFSRPRAGGIRAINLDEGDTVLSVVYSDGTEDIITENSIGYSIRFKQTDLSVLGRTAKGVKAQNLKQGEEIVGIELAHPGKTLMTITEKGFGKRTLLSEYPTIKRGGRGVLDIKTDERNGKVVTMKSVGEDDELFIVTKKKVIRTPVSDVRIIGRNTKGVKIISLDDDDEISKVEKIANEEEGDIDKDQ